LIPVGKIDVCLCLSDIPYFIKHDAVALLAVAFVGEASVIRILTNLVTDFAKKAVCIYPPHSTPTCAHGNCGFNCTDGFTPSPQAKPTTCECQSPNVVCNGTCVDPSSCPSDTAGTRKRSWFGSGSCEDMGPGWATCPAVVGGPSSWECINTASDLESCGGCLSLLPFTPYHSSSGTNCKSLPGVADVECLAGECVVYRCLLQHTLSLDRKRCTPEHPNNNVEFVPASIYGLEHVPLERRN